MSERASTTPGDRPASDRPVVRISAECIRIEPRDAWVRHLGKYVTYAAVVLHKPGCPGVNWATPEFRGGTLEAGMARDALIAWLREIGVEVTP